MHIQEVFNAMYQRHRYEYLVINNGMEIIEFSDRIIEYCDEKILKSSNPGLFALVPELYGLEDKVMEIFQSKCEVIEIPFVEKDDKQHINLTIHPGRVSDINDVITAIILFENVTDFVKMHQISVQNRNENELLLIELKKKNKELKQYNKHMQELVDIETSKNMNLSYEIITTQSEVIATMGAIGETRSKETGDHVLRVAEYSRLLALKVGIDEEAAEELKMASPMHDIGKVGIEDSILNKPGTLTKDEFEIMKTHAFMGYKMLSGSNQKLLQTAAIVAYEHHEQWDGSGYPRGLKGEEIHIYGRITAIADVFDALGHDRIYKKAWSTEKTLEYIVAQSGKHFDPKLVDIFISSIDEFLEIKNLFVNDY